MIEGTDYATEGESDMNVQAEPPSTAEYAGAVIRTLSDALQAVTQTTDVVLRQLDEKDREPTAPPIAVNALVSELEGANRKVAEAEETVRSLNLERRDLREALHAERIAQRGAPRREYEVRVTPTDDHKRFDARGTYKLSEEQHGAVNAVLANLEDHKIIKTYSIQGA